MNVKLVEGMGLIVANQQRKVSAVSLKITQQIKALIRRMFKKVIDLNSIKYRSDNVATKQTS